MRIAFDVDNTLIIKDETGRDVPRYEILQLMFILKQLGNDIYVWSGSGLDYAKTWCEKLGIAHMVTCIEKNITASSHRNIDMTVDDMDCDLSRLNLKV